MMKREVKKIGGAIPFNNFKEKTRIVKQLEREFERVWIKIEDGFVQYEYKEIS